MFSVEMVISIVSFFVLIPLIVVGFILIRKKWDSWSAFISIGIIICTVVLFYSIISLIFLNVVILELVAFVLIYILPVIILVAVAIILRRIIKTLTKDSEELQRRTSMAVLCISSIAILWNALYLILTATSPAYMWRAIVPAIILTLILSFFIFEKYHTHRLLVHTILISLLVPFVVVLIIGAFNTGIRWDIRRLDVGETFITEDGLFEYRLDIRNNGQDNACFRLHAQNTQTGESIVIRFNDRNFDRGWRSRHRRLVRHPESPSTRTHQYLRAEPTNDEGIYEIFLLVYYFSYSRNLSDASIRTRNSPHQWSFYANFNSGELSNPQRIFNVLREQD